LSECRVRRCSVAWRTLSIGVAALGLGGALAGADVDVVARVGSLVVDRARLQARLATVPGERWPELGSAWPERRRRVLDLLIDETLFGVAAEQEPALPRARDVALARALRVELRSERSAPSTAELEAFAARSPDEAALPRAVELSRILVRTEAEARALISELSGVDRARFGQRARETSIDESTSMRGGYLGWVAADGQTDVPELRVAPELFRAAEGTADGELLREPVREAQGFAVVWRRASRAERAPVPAELQRDRVARWADERQGEAERALIETLRQQALTDFHPDRLAGLEPAFPEPARRAPPRSTAPSGPERGQPRLEPVPTDRGLR
jgi:hypothetical protein